MRSQHATAETVMRPEGAASALSGRWLALARAAWAALVALNLVLFVVAVPALFVQRSAPPEPVRAGLVQLGLSEGFYAAYFTVLLVLFGLGCFAVAAVIARRRSTDFMGLFVSLFLVLFGAVNAPNVQALVAVHPALGLPVKFSWGILLIVLLLFPFLFPDGRFVPRWTRVPAGLLTVGIFVALFSGGGSATDPPDALGPVLIAGLLAGAIAQIHRYRRVSNPAQRQQTKWVVFGITAFIAVQVAGILAPISLSRPGVAALLYNVADVTVVTLASLLIPLTIGIAILRHRLWEIDLIINRSLVYGSLTVSVVGLYVLVVGGLGVLLQARGNLLVSLLATGLVAVLFAPLRYRLQRSVNRLMYGERDDPYAAVARLGERLEATLAPEAVLAVVARTVREALKLPYAAIALGVGKESTVAAESGSPVDAPVRLPLVYQGVTAGELLLEPRVGEEGFSPADQRLLDDLAHQAGAAVHAVRLTSDLQRSRERLVTAREEERRRLRRDLHDGLGPTLGSLPLRIDMADDLVESDPDAARELLRSLKEQARGAVTDIRRLVYALRPPALDDLGLTGALDEAAAQHDRNGLRVSVEAPEELPPLSAAVEVAAYRIAQEALTNVARHAGASECIVRLTLSEETRTLRLEIKDDGRGIGAERGHGVGLHSMRERAAELGGECVVEPGPAGGTRVRASLPIPEASGKSKDPKAET